MIADVVTAYVDGATAEGYAEDWDLDKLWTALKTLYPVGARPHGARSDGDGEHGDLTRETLTRGAARRRARGLRRARGRDRRSSARRAACASWSGGCCCRCWTASGASTSTRWTTSRRASACARWRSATRWSSTSARASTCSPRCSTASRRSRSASCSTCRCRPRRAAPARREAAPAARLPRPAAADESVDADPAEPGGRPGGGAHRPHPGAAGNGAGRHAAPEGDAAATTGVLPTVFGGGAPAARRAAVQRPGRGRRHDHPHPLGRRAGGGRPGRTASGAAGEPARNRPVPVRVGPQVQALPRRADGRPPLSRSVGPLGGSSVAAAAGGDGARVTRPRPRSRLAAPGGDHG